MVRTLDAARTIEFLTEQNKRILDKSNYIYYDPSITARQNGRRRKIKPEPIPGLTFGSTIINYYNKFEDETEAIKINDFADPGSVERYRTLDPKYYNKLHKTFTKACKQYENALKTYTRLVKIVQKKQKQKTLNSKNIEIYRQKLTTAYEKIQETAKNFEDPGIAEFVNYVDIDCDRVLSTAEINAVSKKVNQKKYDLKENIPGHVNIFGKLSDAGYRTLDVSKESFGKNLSGKDKKISDTELLAYLKYADKDGDGTVTNKERKAANKKINHAPVRVRREIREIHNSIEKPKERGSIFALH